MGNGETVETKGRGTVSTLQQVLLLETNNLDILKSYCITKYLVRWKIIRYSIVTKCMSKTLQGRFSNSSVSIILTNVTTLKMK